MSDPAPLAPWSHPKAQQWFATILEKSGFVEEIEEQINPQNDLLDMHSGRLLIAILAMLGRPGVWPAQHRMVLARAANRVDRLSKNQQPEEPAKSRRKKKPLTLQEHQKHAQSVSALETEVEMVRRWGGASNRKTSIQQPPSWGQFWR